MGKGIPFPPKKKRLKTYVLTVNNQPISQCLVKRKKTSAEFLKLNVKVHNTQSRAKYERRDRKKSTYVSLNRIIKVILNYPDDLIWSNLSRFFLSL